MKNTDWWKITVHVEGDVSDFDGQHVIDNVSNLLIKHGSYNGVEFSDGNGQCIITGYFQTIIDGELSNFDKEIKRIDAENSCVITYNIEPFKGQDWSENWKRFFKPINLMDELLIVPKWEAGTAEPGGKKVIVLNPGTGFGTGHHETTRLALESLIAICKNHMPGKMLDVGCGSGILSIGGKLLGIERVTAFDIDYDAVLNAAENIHENKLDKHIKLFVGEIVSVKDSYDLIVANITSETLKIIKDDILSRLRKNGKLVLSGILREQVYHVKRLYLAHPLMRFLDLQESKSEARPEEIWATLIFEKISPPQKHPCRGCEYCQFCSDSRCNLCFQRQNINNERKCCKNV